eukprot:TRINITY_DN5474_c0_g2_i2.p1 TRINITY_DN5474_c0_g2~~TRINITY_DN5474_c0_g2_i2.p1  ORF type:complete len:217 (-),score=29.76 TRINITY_DN5474_c0_g2_i2:138-788(-)
MACATRRAPEHCSHSLRRDGALSSRSISLTWVSPPGSASQHVGIVRVGAHHQTPSTIPSEPTEYQFQRSASASHTLRHLDPASTYAVLVRTQFGSNLRYSDPVLLRTQPAIGIFTDLYRVSEYTYEIDLLANHDSASASAQAGFLTATNDNDFFKLAKAPVTRYCIHRLEVPPGAGGRVETFAPYISCNGPEAAPRNHPSDPVSYTHLTLPTKRIV